MNKKQHYMQDTIVGLQATLTGHLDTDQPLCIHGVFEGDLKATNTVFIDKEGLVSADVAAERIVVQGTVIGNICAGRVEVYTGGKVWGDICAQTLYVEAGGFVRGQVIISRESEPGFNPQSLESFDDLTHVFVELEAAAQAPSLVDDLTDQLTHTAIGQFVVEADVAQNDLSHAQAIAEQLTTDLDTTCQHIEQLTAERDTFQTTVAQLVRDLDAVEQQGMHTTNKLTQVQASAEQHTTQRGTVQAKLDEAQAATVQLTADLETARRQVARPVTQLVEKKAEIASPEAELEMSQDQVGQQQQAYTAYCLVCRAHRHIEGAREVVIPDGRRAVKGRCSVCGISFLTQLHSD